MYVPATEVTCARDAGAGRSGGRPDVRAVCEVARAREGAILQAKIEQSIEPIEDFRSIFFKFILTRP